MIIIVISFFVPMRIVTGLTLDRSIYMDWINWKKKYINTIWETKTIISTKFDNIKRVFFNDFDSFNNNLIKYLNVKKQVKLNNIDHMKIPG